MAGKYLLFITRPTGYELAEREGEPPSLGSDLEVEDGGRRFIVSKVASSPLPQDDRLCVYLEER